MITMHFQMDEKLDNLVSEGFRYDIYRPFGYGRVYLPLSKVADTPFHIRGDDI